MARYTDLRVAHIIAPAAFGGAESVVLGLARGGPSVGCDPLIIVVRGDTSDPFVAQARSLGLAVIEVPGGGRSYLREARGIEAVLRRERPDLVHTHVYHADFVGFLAARRASIPAVATLHGHTAGDWRNRLYEWADRKLLGRFAAVLCVAQHGMESLRRAGCRPDRLALVPNGYVPRRSLDRHEARARLGLASDSRVIGWIGRLSPEKGADLLVAAVAALPECDVVTLVVGAGSELDRIGLAIQAHQLSPDRFRLAGGIPDAGALMSAFDVLAISSRSEGLPMVLLEAMSARVPIAAFAVGGIPGVLSQETAWLAPPGDVMALAQALHQAVTDRSEVTRRVANAHARLLSEYSTERWLGRVREAYDRVLAGEPQLA